MTHAFNIVPNRVVPRDQRIVEQPIDGCPAFVVSDIIPVDSVDATLLTALQAGTALFGQVNWGNAPVGTPWDTYVLKRIQRSTIPGFARLTFCAAFTQNDIDTPYKTENAWGDHPWPAVLRKVRFIEAVGTPHSGKDASGNTFIAKRLLARVSYIPEQSEGSYFKIEHFVSSLPHAIPRYDAPQVGAVSYDFLGLEDSFQKCLHGDMRFDPQLNAIVAYTAGGSEVPGATSVSGQFFPATNMEEWESYVTSDREELIDILYKRTRITVDPPDEPEEITV